MIQFLEIVYGIGIMLGIGFFALLVYVIVYFFRVANDVHKIKETVNNVPTGNSIAILKILDGEKEEAIRLIRETFIHDSIAMFEKYYFKGNTDMEGYAIIDKYVWRYRNILPEINKEYLKVIYESVEKVFVKEEVIDKE